MSHLDSLILAFSTNFFLLKSDLSGNTVLLHASGFQKIRNVEWDFFSSFSFIFKHCADSRISKEVYLDIKT